MVTEFSGSLYLDMAVSTTLSPPPAGLLGASLPRELQQQLQCCEVRGGYLESEERER